MRRPRLFESGEQAEGFFLGAIAGAAIGLLTCGAGCGGAPADCRTEGCRTGLLCQRHLHPGDTTPVYECLQPKPAGLTVEGCPSGSCEEPETE